MTAQKRRFMLPITSSDVAHHFHCQLNSWSSSHKKSEVDGHISPIGNFQIGARNLFSAVTGITNPGTNSHEATAKWRLEPLRKKRNCSSLDTIVRLKPISKMHVHAKRGEQTTDAHGCIGHMKWRLTADATPEDWRKIRNRQNVQFEIEFAK